MDHYRFPSDEQSYRMRLRSQPAMFECDRAEQFRAYEGTYNRDEKELWKVSGSTTIQSAKSHAAMMRMILRTALDMSQIGMSAGANLSARTSFRSFYGQKNIQCRPFALLKFLKYPCRQRMLQAPINPVILKGAC